jgi:hypothetical protein
MRVNVIAGGPFPCAFELVPETEAEKALVNVFLRTEGKVYPDIYIYGSLFDCDSGRKSICIAWQDKTK